MTVKMSVHETHLVISSKKCWDNPLSKDEEVLVRLSFDLSVCAHGITCFSRTAGNLERTSKTLATVRCDAEEPCSANTT